MYNFQDFFWFSFLVELKNLIFESLIIFIVLSHFFRVIYCGYIILCHYRTLIYEKIEKKSYIDGEISLFFLYKNEKKKKKIFSIKYISLLIYYYFFFNIYVCFSSFPDLRFKNKCYLWTLYVWKYTPTQSYIYIFIIKIIDF